MSGKQVSSSYYRRLLVEIQRANGAVVSGDRNILVSDLVRMHASAPHRVQGLGFNIAGNLSLSGLPATVWDPQRVVHHLKARSSAKNMSNIFTCCAR